MNEPGHVIVGLDHNVPVIEGQCPKCRIGLRSMILMDFIPHEVKKEEGIIYMKCVGCLSIYQTKVKHVVNK
jgi:hypothetical protein